MRMAMKGVRIGKTRAALSPRVGLRAPLAALALMGMLASQARAEARHPSQPDPEASARGESSPVRERSRSADASPGMGEFDAELIRRARGEWVIVSLAPSAPTGEVAMADPRAAAPSASDEQGVQASLRAYEQALEGRDLEQLARVWIMNPTEREELRRFFARAESVSVVTDPTHLVIQGNRAALRFAQRFAASLRPGLGRAFRSFERALAAHDAYATWSLDQLSHPN